MSNRQKGDQGEYEFTRAAYDELREAGHSLGTEFVTHLQPTGNRGVWELTVVGWKPEADGADRRLASYTMTWPNSTPQSFGAFLYSCCHRCVRMVEQALSAEALAEMESW